MRKSTLLALLVCFTAIGLFSSCEKEKEDDSVTMVTSTGVTYELNGTSWKAGGVWGKEYYLSFTSDRNGILRDVSDSDDTFSFTYTLDGSYGIVTFSGGEAQFLSFPDVSRELELHLISKDKLSFGGCVFTRQ